MSEIKLQPLRIPSGWTVIYNSFSEYAPLTDSPEGLDELNEDMFQAQNERLITDPGRYPETDICGSYVLLLGSRKAERPFERPLAVFKSRSKAETVKKLEEWLGLEKKLEIIGSQ
ncbi:MAG: hypothetical protein K6B74_08960 [Ruminococcus sp.]|nr:hypothetical protein [Ruminococcus sp.]